MSAILPRGDVTYRLRTAALEGPAQKSEVSSQTMATGASQLRGSTTTFLFHLILSLAFTEEYHRQAVKRPGW